jgi:predicted nucleic acid-binding protein
VAGGSRLILVDTTVWIDFFNGRSSPEKRAFERLLERGEMICLTDVILTEILRGITADSEFETARHYLQQFPCLTARAPATYLHAAELYRKARRKGVTVRSTIDCLIAAVCLENDVALLHHDSDFDLLAKTCRLRISDPAKIL